MQAQVAFRVLLSADRTGPLVVADEIGYLANARVLAGGPPIDLHTATFYYAGSSLFMAPAFMLADDPVRIYHLVLVLQALVSATVLPLLYGLLRELEVSRALALAAAVAASAVVGATFWSGYALSESTLAPLIVAWIWLTIRMVRRGRTGLVSSILLGLTFGMLAASHSRGMVLVAVGGLVCVATIRRTGWRNVVACAATGATAVSMGVWLNIWVLHVNYPGRADSGLLPHGGSGPAAALADLLIHGLGQYWYVMAATGLLAGYGLAYAWYLAVAGPATVRTSFVVAAPLITLALGAVTFGSASLMTFVPSPDYLVYGRYVAPLVPVLVAIGIVGLLRRSSRAVWAIRAGLLACAVGLALAVRTQTARFDLAIQARPFSIPGVSALADLVAGDGGHLHEFRVTAVAAAFFGALCVGSALRGRWARNVLVLAATAAFACLSAHATASITLASNRAAFPGGVAAMDLPLVKHSRSIAWDTNIAGGGVSNIVTRMSFAYYATRAKLVLFDSTNQSPPADVVAASKQWDGAADGYRKAQVIQGSDIVIWTA